MSSQLEELVENLIYDGTKCGWYPERIAAWDRGEKIAPVTIDCAMTRACNAACDFCYASLQANEGEGKVTKEHFLAFLDDASAIGVKGVSFISDGESTVVPWYVDAVKHAHKVGLKIGVGSNGIKLTKPVLEEILPLVSYVRFNFSAGERVPYSRIMGLPQSCFDDVCQNIRDGMEIIRRDKLSVSLNVQMVLDPKHADQIMPFARLVRDLKPVYGVLKHCADDSVGTLGVDYSKYAALEPLFDEAEAMSTPECKIVVKRARLDGKRNYDRCYGSAFILQVSGSGLVANCGFHFNAKYRKFHLGSIVTQRFRDIWASDRYDEVLRYLGSEHFSPKGGRCGPNCLQHNTCDWLYRYKEGTVSLPTVPPPPDLAFI